MAVTMTDLDVIQRLHATVGRGTIVGPYLVRTGNKPTYRWTLYKIQDRLWLCEQILPWMGQRRSERIAEVVQALTTPRAGKIVITNCGRHCEGEAGQAGWAAHIRKNEIPCDGCLVARALYMSNWKKEHSLVS